MIRRQRLLSRCAVGHRYSIPLKAIPLSIDASFSGLLECCHDSSADSISLNARPRNVARDKAVARTLRAATLPPQTSIRSDWWCADAARVLCQPGSHRTPAVVAALQRQRFSVTFGYLAEWVSTKRLNATSASARVAAIQMSCIAFFVRPCCDFAGNALSTLRSILCKPAAPDASSAGRLPPSPTRIPSRHHRRPATALLADHVF